MAETITKLRQEYCDGIISRREFIQRAVGLDREPGCSNGPYRFAVPIVGPYRSGRSQRSGADIQRDQI